MTCPAISRGSTYKKLPALFAVALLLSLLLSACGGDAQTQQKANQNKTNFDNAIAHAQSIGVPDSLLQPIIQQSQQLNKSNAPLALVDQPVTDYYSNLAQRYQMLTLQVQGLEVQATQQLDYQAAQDLQTFGTVLSQRQAQGFVSAQKFSDILTQQQSKLNQAKLPKDYALISNQAQTSTAALRMMGPANDKLNSFRSLVSQLKASKLDTMAADKQINDDVTLFRAANTSEDFTKLIGQINAQTTQLNTLSTQAIPYVGAAKLQQLSDNIKQMKQYGVNTTSYEKKLQDDKTALDSAKSLSDFLKVSSRIDSDLSSTELPMLSGKANYLLKQFHQKVKQFGDTHQFHDTFNGVTYRMGFEYDTLGVGEDLDAAVAAAQTKDDYLGAIDWINYETAHLKANADNYNDKTPFNQPHATDQRLMQLHGATSGKVIIVSLTEQAVRVYQDGKLIRATQIVTGQYDKPSVPGLWHIFVRESPTVFKSTEPKGSALWYPDTKIKYAMEYHEGGYFFHDSWWRAVYGPGKQFPHYDPSGDETFGGTGSHGCFNMPPDEAAWLYNNTGYNTPVIVY
ncbi:MAG: L,D-transpeptidase family protein [Ktedonobacteraceae bacterium]|nr:L,D-transpeptidase family protein [Ktedonobacteraceae bacterium]MBO0793319.1 L,D-transpeptidase family protein [Ktedonobacteraceae bacterium]